MALWTTTGAADTYFSTRFNASEFWSDSILTSNDKTAVLTTAQAMIEASGLFTFTDAEIETPTDAMKEAAYEQALFMLRDPDGIEARAALQAQGVTEAGIVKEEYSGSGESIPIAPMARKILSGNQSGTAGQFDVVR